MMACLISGFVPRLARPVSLVEQELFTLTEFTPVFSGVRVIRSLLLCVCFVDHSLAIVLLVLLRITASGYPFGIFKLF
jgi:hypothetical protein